MESISVRDLTPGKNVRQIQVRLIQSWENWNQANEMYEIGLLFSDNQGHIIEGCISKDRVHIFKGKLKENAIYSVERFMLTGQKTKHRVTNHLHRIKLAKNTKFVEVFPPPQDFPPYKYQIKSFDELESRMGDSTYVSDVIGMAVQQTDVIPSKTNQDPRRQIRIKDNNDKVAVVTLWGRHADNFEAQILYEESAKHNVAVLFTGVTVSSFSGLLAFMSTSLTRWHFNPEISEAEILHDSFQNQHCLVEWDGRGTAAAEPSETTLSALGCADLADIVGKRFKLNIHISDVNEPHNWCFYSCKKCFSGTKLHEGTRKCRRCPSTESTQRYKLSVNAIDVDVDSTANKIVGRFMFYGDGAAAVIGKDIALLLAQAKEKSNFIPPAITDTVGKKCTVEAVIKDETYDVDEEDVIIFEVKKAKVLNQQPSGENRVDRLNTRASISQAVIPTATKTPALLASPLDTTQPAETDVNTENTPIKDIIDQDVSEADKEQTSKSNFKKRKPKASASTATNEKEASDAKEPRAKKELRFTSDQ